MNILISGDCGFIGQHLVSKLIELKHNLRGMYIRHSEMEDIRSYADCLVNTKGQDCVVHLAAFTDVQESLKDKLSYCQNNIQGTVNLLEASRANGVKRFIFASSAAAQNPQSPYGVTKLCGEIWCDIFQKCYGLSTVSLRFFNVYGKGTDRGVIPTWIKKIKNGERITVYGGNQVRDFIYIEDIVSAIIHAIDIEDVGVYEVGTGKGTRMKNLCTTIFDIVGSEHEKILMPQKTGDIYLSTAYTNQEHLDYRKTGWRAQYTLEQGLREMLR
jgi:UDP-glucose 4-epimerase